MSPIRDCIYPRGQQSGPTIMLSGPILVEPWRRRQNEQDGDMPDQLDPLAEATVG
jgi:hypothetical protein